MADDGGPWLTLSGCKRWMHGGNGDGLSMEDKDGGQTGYPDEFSTPKLDKIEIFHNVRRNQ